MNSKEFKADKKLKKNKSNLKKNGGQQIFVLPPNLLQKLGINLGNMGSTSISPDVGHNISTCVPSHKHGDSPSNMGHEMNSNIMINETSMTKTASLMKESVFLSPTFNTENLNNIISSPVGGNGEVCNAEIHLASEISKKNIDENVSSSNVMAEYDLLNDNKLEDQYIDSPCSVGLIIEDNTSHINGTTTSEKSALNNETKKLINIISEETVTVAKLNELKVLQKPSKTTMIPASLNTIIAKNVKNNSIQSQSLPTISKSSTDNTNLQCSVSDETFINNEIELSEIENIVNINQNISHINDTLFNSDKIENHMLHFLSDKKVSENKNIQAIGCIKTELNKLFDTDEFINTTINKPCSLDSIIQKNLDFSPSLNNFGVIDQVLAEESGSTDQDLTDHVKSSLSNNNNHPDFTKQINDNTLEPVKLDNINIEAYLPEIINTNNDIWNYNKSDVDQNDMLMPKVTTCVDNEQQKNVETCNSQIYKDNSNVQSESSFIDTCTEHNNIADNSKICTLVHSTIQIYKDKFVGEQDIPLEVINNNNAPSVLESLQCVNNQPHSAIHDDEEISKVTLPLNPKRNNLMSKLCIQGVEKPGGIKSNICTTVSLKTYSNNKKLKVHRKCLSSEETTFDVKFDLGSNINLSETTSINFLSYQQFCICCDYGILDYNQCENSYEHIHFTMRRPLDCDPDIIFGIYDNEIINTGDTRQNPDSIEDDTDQTDSKYIEQSICWHNAGSVQNNFDTEFENYQDKEKMSPKHTQVEHLIVNDSHTMKICPDISDNDYNIDHQIQKPEVTDLHYPLKVKPDSNCSSDIRDMDDITNADKKSNSNQIGKESKKRKISNTCNEVSNNKKTKNFPNHEVSKEQLAEIQLKDHDAKHGVKGWKESNNIVNEEFHNMANKQEQVKCAVCGVHVINAEWSTHIASTHDYIAWKEGDPPVNLEDEDAIRLHLHHIVQELGQLECSNCGLSRKYAKAFLQHIKSCYSSSDINDERKLPYHLSKITDIGTVTNCNHCGYTSKSARDYATHVKRCTKKSASDNMPHPRITKENTDVEVSSSVTCGVCKETVTSQQWMTHIQQEHSYQAWREGETPLDIENKEAVRKHLYTMVQEYGPLVCSKCDKSHKYVKLFLQHVENCTGPKEHDNSLDKYHAELESVIDTSLQDNGLESIKMVKCGRCQLEMESKEWIAHIQKKHNYLSWQEGKTPLDISDKEAVRKYLYFLVQKLGSLACAKCGVARKYVKSYLSHIENCKEPMKSDANSTINTSVTPRQSIRVENSVDADIYSQQLNTISTVPSIASQNSDVSNINDTSITTAQSVEVENSMDVNISSLPLNTTSPASALPSQVQPDIIIKCGVCKKEIKDSNWITHIGINHEYVAWKEIDIPIDLSNYEAICQHLTKILEEIGALRCIDCGRKCKCAKAYLMHIKACYGKTYGTIEDAGSTFNDTISDMDATLDTTYVDEDDNEPGTVKCGVCGEEMEAQLWIDHSHQQHNYLAWRDGETALDLENEELICSYLQSIVRKIGRLTCAKCGYRRRKLLEFFTHIKSCHENAISPDKSLKCGVCQSEVVDALWIEHIAKEHDYIAWREGLTPLNVDDETSVRDHLYKIVQQARELICSKCGKSRKYVKSYLQHIRNCTGPEESTDGAFKEVIVKNEPSEIVTCALCRLEMNESMWFDHISKEHNYVSWKKNEPPLVFEDEKSLRDHLYNIVQSVGSLTCNKCGLVRKYAKSYLMHIETCQQVTWITINKMIVKVKKEKGYIVRCAVCGASVDDTEWLEHSFSQHNYLAWRDCEPALNVEDKGAVRKHLEKIIREEGYIKCPKCNLHRKYAKQYQHHVSNCDGTGEEMNDSVKERDLSSEDDTDGVEMSEAVKCAVCAQMVRRASWIAHIQKKHKYLAWEDGQEPLDLDDKEAVYKHLSAINAKCKGLTCSSCGTVRKYVRAYLHHVQDCVERTNPDSDEIVECGVCGEKVEGKFWRNHAMQMHYNIAWVVGDTPIDLRNIFSVDKYLKEYHEYKHKLVCNICGLCRASLAGFYAHILICGKTDEEIDSWKDVCTICNQKYLCIYKTQHYWAHRAQETAKERKIQDTLKKEESINDEMTCTPGRRKAAEKARSVIGDYAARIASHKCKCCPYESESKEDLANHHCSKRIGNSNEDSDDSVSIKLEDYSEEESEDTDVDSSLSNEEEESIVFAESNKKIKNEILGSKVRNKISKFPFEVRDSRSYLRESKTDHFKLFYTRETLFKHWRECNFKVVSDELTSQYTPQLEESCKVSISNGGWTTYKRFESRKEHGCKVIFTGGSIQCIAWAPEHPNSTRTCSSFLAVATHRGSDCPRFQSTDTVCHPALIQMWDFQTFKCLPKLAFGLAHDYGTVWGMDWCPSGARDIENRDESDIDAAPRLGLLALACSNGSAYIVSVPYPDKSLTSDIIYYKIKPCVELRVTRGSNKYQATSINWSLFKGYTTILVGYGDGTVAMYDLVSESPILTAKEGDVTILYPFQDERIHNASVTGLTSCVLGAWCSSSVTGSTAGVASAEPRAGRGARPLRAHSALAASAATFMPHWPNVLLSGDDTIVGLSPSELEWGYVGRRVGSLRALTSCVHRARVVAMVPPLLQAMRPHPAAFKGHKTIHKKNVAMIEMTPLAKKRSKHSNDELSMKVEPITYEEAVASYGIEFKFERDFDKAFLQRIQQKHRVPYPERFPLADVPALAYCPAAAHYTKLAVAIHSGLLLLIDV